MLFEDLKKICFSKDEINAIYKNLKEKTIVIYGAGQAGESARSYFEQIGIKVDYFSDSDQSKYGKKISNIDCVDKEEIKNIDNVFVVVSVHIHFKVVAEFLKKDNIEFIDFDSFAISNSTEELEKVYKLLNDSYSKEVFTKVLYSRFYSSTNILNEIYSENQYFEMNKFTPKLSNEIFVDCGAYTGDTLVEFLKEYTDFGSYYAFEPFEINYNTLVNTVNELVGSKSNLKSKIVAEMMAIGNDDAFVSLINDYDANVPGATFETVANDSGIKVAKIDTYFKDTNSPTFIKADVEGFEMSLLQGAEETIKTKAPKIAICIYHKFEDLYTIINYIKSVDNSYKFGVRHHSKVNFAETVLYAWVEN